MPTTTAPPEDRHAIQPGDDSDNVKIDKEFEGLIPPLSPSELADLHKSLESEGCRDALIVWKGQNLLVDGHNRLRWCRDKGEPFEVIEREFADRDQVKAFIIHTQLGRRNLSPGAESYLRGKRYLELKQQGARTDLATSGHSDQKSTADLLAEEFKVGEKTIRRDARFAEAVDKIVENCGQDTRNLLLSRDLGLTRGGVLRLSRLKPAEQKRFVQELTESGKRPRKPRKARGRSPLLRLPSKPKELVQALIQQLGEKELAQVAKELAEAMKASTDGKQEPQGQPNGKRRGRKAK